MIGGRRWRSFGETQPLLQCEPQLLGNCGLANTRDGLAMRQFLNVESVFAKGVTVFGNASCKIVLAVNSKETRVIEPDSVKLHGHLGVATNLQPFSNELVTR